MKIIEDVEFIGERPLYMERDVNMRHVTIHVGESAVKECKNIRATDCRFEGKYVFWETDGVECRNCYFADTARASVWYSRQIAFCDCRIDAPKIFRRSHGIDIERTNITNAQETFWNCRNIRLKDVEISNGDYTFMNCADIQIDGYRHNGNYAFQSARDVVIRNAIINSKDAFWDSENCTLYDCEISGEYLGWYAKNLRLVRCRISGSQPLCYCNNLILEDCTFAGDADLALEYSTVQATISGHITSIKNPTSGRIVTDSVGEIIIDDNQKMPADCEIVVKDGNSIL